MLKGKEQFAVAIRSQKSAQECRAERSRQLFTWHHGAKASSHLEPGCVLELLVHRLDLRSLRPLAHMSSSLVALHPQSDVRASMTRCRDVKGTGV